jgi:4-amino-4-deoxy-L-arabinose transferase-like glycosyltransferase
MTLRPEQGVAPGEGTKQNGLSPAMTGSRGALLLGLVVTALVSYLAFFVGLGDASLWHSQEGRVALIAQHMLQSGDWITPKAQGDEVAGGKPVLYHWLVAAWGWMRGLDEVAVRGPSAGAAVALTIVLYLWVRRLTDDRSGLVAALAFATSLLVMSLARCAHVDMLFTLWVVLVYYFFFLGYQEEGHRQRWFLLSYVALALAVMTKGPVGLVLVVVGVGTFLLVRGELGLLRKMQLVPGTLIFLALAAPWYVAVTVKTHGQFLAEFLVKQNIDRFFTVRSHLSHPSKGDPWWFYGPELLLATLPWTPLLVAALFSRARALWRRGETAPRESASALATAWFASGLLLLSLSKGKRLDYLLPLIPSLALLGGCFWHSAFSQEQKGGRPLGRIAAAGQALLLTVATGSLLSLAVLAPLSDWWRRSVLEPFFSRQPALLSSLVGAFGHSLLLGLAVTLALALGAWLWLKAGFARPALRGSRGWHLTWATFAFTAALALAGQWLYCRTVLPVLEKHRGLRAVGVEINRVVAQGESVAVFAACPYDLIFYLSRPPEVLPADDTGTLAERAGGPAPFYYLLPLEEYLHLPAELREQLQPLYQTSPEVRQQLVLAANNPARARAGLTTGKGDARTGDPKGRQ